MRKILLVSFISIVLFLVIDFFLGKKIHNFFVVDSPAIKHEVFYQNLKPNYRKEHTFIGNYLLCTDKNGFKSSCDTKKITKRFDVAFIGDSFTEGVGLTYKESFVGLFAERYNNLEIVNLGVHRYAPTIYFKKLEYFFNQGYRFDRIIIFIDVGDIYEENFYEIVDQKVIKNNYPSILFNNYTLSQKIKLYIKGNFIHLSKLYYQIIKFKDYAVGASTKMERDSFSRHHLLINSRWTYDNKFSANDYIWVNNGIEKSKKMIDKIFAIAEKFDSQISIAVYPWPAQVLYDSGKSKQSKIWKKFCEKKCEFFIDVFETFDEIKERKGSEYVVLNYYFPNNIHYNKEGNVLIFKKLNSYFDKIY